jgi:hypothetical protein
MKTIFKKGDRVFHIQHGWGTFDEVLDEYLVIIFDGRSKNDDKIIFPKFQNKTLSFTEYTLEGFSQERPEELPKKGDVVWVRDELPSVWIVGHFYGKQNGKYYIAKSPNMLGWTTNGTEITTKNPYADEQ